MWSYVGYEGDVGNTFEPVEDDEFLIFNNYHFMTMSMDYALATITGTYSYTVKEINEQGENNVSDIEYDPSVYTVTVNVDENMDMSITCIKNGTNVDNSSESVDGISFENKMSVTAAAIDPAVKKVLNNAELQPGEFTFQLFDENNSLIDTKKNTDNGSVLFDSIIFDEVGDYNYTIKELIQMVIWHLNTKENHNQKFVDVVKTVKTGDTARIGLFAILSIAAIVVVIIVLRRRKNS